MSNELSKAYDPSAIEERWAEYWVRERLFNVSTPPYTPDTPVSTKKFTLLLPPPNVTGRLHMGHMLNQTEMDILTRWHRMSGDLALWVPGTDHAGIATQMMVERQLTAEGTSREALGREAFTDRVWQWKELYGSAILDQMKRLGASVDWSRTYFTMDDNLSVAVREAFVRLHEQGLIYRGSYIVNWDPVLQSAVSDLEVESEERAGKLYFIRYPFAGTRPAGPYDDTDSLVIATTRPETLLGDTAVAVNPTDPRYAHLVGTELELPLTGRTIPLLGDDWVTPEFGTGAVKVTPAHDPNDFAIGKRHNLPQLSILDKTAHIDLPGSPFHGLDRYEARTRVVAELEALGLLVAVKEHPMTVPVSQRSGAVIEPRLSDQWFLAVNKTPEAGGDSIAAKAVAAVREGHISFTPAMYEKIYGEWMGNIHDWCISRQLWWGHRIPAWHCAACPGITVARETPATCAHCASADITQETDVLDTWFSSALLPFTVFGWPGTSPDLAAFYPTDLLVTGFDILFFWVARMIMLGTHFMLEVPLPDGSPRTLADAVPFRQVYIHALVRDADRQKMSKTKGNVIDPIDIIGRFGTDAVRFTLASMASPGTDIAFSEARTEGNRAFANKIWNAARFLFLNLDRAREAGITIDLATLRAALPLRPVYDVAFAQRYAKQAMPICAENSEIEARWILSRLHNVSSQVSTVLAMYRFDEAASLIYDFVWGDFCDWYLEALKVRLSFQDNSQNETLRSSLTTAIEVFEASLRLLSPFMPFLTEELWHSLFIETPARSISLTWYPLHNGKVAIPVPEMDLVRELVTLIRQARKVAGVPENQLADLTVSTLKELQELVSQNDKLIAKLARISSLSFVHDLPAGNGVVSSSRFDVVVTYSRAINIPAERERLTKELAKYEKGLAAANRQLSNEAFTAKAPAHIIEGLRKQAAETQILYDKATAALSSLPS